MSYITDVRPAAQSASKANPQSAAARETTRALKNTHALAVHPISGAATRVSEALEATMLVATLSGVSLVLSTVAAGAF